MGDLTIAQDLIAGVVDIMAEVGWTHTFRIITYGPPSPTNPGAGPTETIDDTDLEAFVFDFIQEYMPSANVLEGGLMAILSIDPLSETQAQNIKPGTYLIDIGTSKKYSVIKTDTIKVAGVPVTALLQLKG